MKRMLTCFFVTSIILGSSVIYSNPSEQTKQDIQQRNLDHNDQFYKYIQFLILKEQNEMYKNMNIEQKKENISSQTDNIDKPKNIKALLLKSIGKSAKSGLIQGVDLLGTAALEGVRVIFKGGVFIVFTGLTAAALWNILLFSGQKPVKLVGVAIKKLVACGWNVGMGIFSFGAKVN